MFKRSPSLTEQVKSHLKKRIINDTFESGRIPAETDLAAELKVSRNTIRDALSRLEAEGTIFRKQGAGTFVNKAGLLVKTRLEEIVSYETMIREYGYTPTVHLISTEETASDPQLEAELNLKPGAHLLVIRKLFMADDKPVIFTLTTIPTEIIQLAYTPDDIRAPITDFLRRFCNHEFGYYLSEIVPLISPNWLAKKLDLPQSQTAILSFEEIAYNKNNDPVAKACSYFNNNLLHLRLIRRPGH